MTCPACEKVHATGVHHALDALAEASGGIKRAIDALHADPRFSGICTEDPPWANLQDLDRWISQIYGRLSSAA